MKKKIPRRSTAFTAGVEVEQPGDEALGSGQERLRGGRPADRIAGGESDLAARPLRPVGELAHLALDRVGTERRGFLTQTRHLAHAGLDAEQPMATGTGDRVGEAPDSGGTAAISHCAFGSAGRVFRPAGAVDAGPDAGRIGPCPIEAVEGGQGIDLLVQRATGR